MMKLRHYNISPYDAKCIGLPFHGDFYRKQDIDNIVSFNMIQKDLLKMSDIMDDLQPCPFCGAKAEIVRRYIADKTYWYWIRCMKCKAETTDAYNINDAIRAWNIRNKGV